MPRLLPKLSFLSLLAGLPAAVFSQTTIVSYTFEGTTTAIIGSAITAVTWNSGGAEGHASTGVFANQGQALSVGNFQIAEYYQITLDATGYSDVVLNSFRSNASDSAPLDWKISYSLTGISGSYTDATTYTLSNSTAVSSTTIAGFSLPTGANNNSSIVLRLIATSSTRIDGGGAAASGTVRLDNVSFTATAIPEPSTYAALAGMAALLFRFLQRRRESSARNTGQ